MKIIIVGCGKFGTRLANYLNNQNHDVTIIDNREEALIILVVILPDGQYWEWGTIKMF